MYVTRIPARNKIRAATLKDLDFLVSTSEIFNNKYQKLTLNTKKLAAHIRKLLLSDTGIAFRSDAGMILGVCYSDPIRDHNIAVELAWWDTGGTGLKLLRAFEQDAKKRGMDEVRMTSLTENPRVNPFLEKLGYNPIEISYSKSLQE